MERFEVLCSAQGTKTTAERNIVVMEPDEQRAVFAAGAVLGAEFPPDIYRLTLLGVRSESEALQP